MRQQSTTSANDAGDESCVTRRSQVGRHAHPAKLGPRTYRYRTNAGPNDCTVKKKFVVNGKDIIQYQHNRGAVKNTSNDTGGDESGAMKLSHVGWHAHRTKLGPRTYGYH